MADINDVILIGYVSSPIELRKTPAGQSVTTINLVTGRKKIIGNDVKSNITHHSIVLWKKHAEYASSTFKVGTQICVSGRLQTRKWTSKDGITKFKTEVIADNVSLAETKEGLKENKNDFVSSVNSVRIYGNIVKDFEIRTTPAGNKVTNLIVATKYVWINKDNKKEEKQEFNNIVVWDELAEIAEMYLSKGSKVYIEGMIVNKIHENKSGQRKISTEILAEKLIPTSISPSKRISEVLSNQKKLNNISNESNSNNESIFSDII